MLAKTKLAKNVAIVKYGRMPWPINNLFTPEFYSFAFFDDYDLAVNWLHAKKDA